MRNIKFIVPALILLCVGCQLQPSSPKNPSTELYPIIEGALWGYIDETGKEIISPSFHEASHFSEGLAAVRPKGLYGFINTNGDFVITPKYDLAHPFKNGIAKVFLNGKPFFINKNGEILFQHSFDQLSDFNEHNVAIVTTKYGHHGIINIQGQILLDTLYETIWPFENGRTIVFSSPDNPKTELSKKGVIDPRGKFVVPLGLYDRISPFDNGFAIVNLPENSIDPTIKNDQAVIDTAGNLLFEIPSREWAFNLYYQSFHQGLETIKIHLIDPDTQTTWTSWERYSYSGIVNTKGHILFSNKDWDYISPFSENRAFIKNSKESWFMIDLDGNLVADRPYLNVLYSSNYDDNQVPFQEGIALVETKEGWYGIDTMGQYKYGPLTFDLTGMAKQRIGDLLVFSTYKYGENDQVQNLHGFWNFKTNQLIEPVFQDIDFTADQTSIKMVLKDDRLSYINPRGEFVWIEKLNRHKKYPYNIDYMNRGYFYAFSPRQNEMDHLNGWGASDNIFKKIPGRHAYKKNQLGVYVNSEPKQVYKNKYEGQNLSVANTTQDTFFFEAQDNRLYLKIQAIDKNGQWRNIEYFPNSWCGNSYHSVFLPPDHYWGFIIPKYEGAYETQMRAHLLYKQNQDTDKIDTLISHSFSGSVNPGQFWNQKTYSPTSIMDPYNN